MGGYERCGRDGQKCDWANEVLESAMEGRMGEGIAWWLVRQMGGFVDGQKGAWMGWQIKGKVGGQNGR